MQKKIDGGKPVNGNISSKETELNEVLKKEKRGSRKRQISQDIAKLEVEIIDLINI